jgi:hypothetical protein
MILTLSQLNRATLDVQGELYEHGFWGEGTRLTKTEIFWCAFPLITSPVASGLFYHSTGKLDALWGFQAGHIYIPKWSLSRLPWRKGDSIRDILRHEYFHSISHHYRMLIQRSPRFRKVFGGDYNDSDHPRAGKEGEFVSQYAQTDPAEDMAEVGMLFLKHKGKLPTRFNTPAIKKKWQFIRDLGERVGSGHYSWQ